MYTVHGVCSLLSDKVKTPAVFPLYFPLCHSTDNPYNTDCLVIHSYISDIASSTVPLQLRPFYLAFENIVFRQRVDDGVYSAGEVRSISRQHSEPRQQQQQ